MRRLLKDNANGPHPADFLLLVDTHSDYFTGGLIHGIGPDGTPWNAPATQVSTLLTILFSYQMRM